jgi:DNA-binding NarL/FixJ family response regulator
VVEDVLHRYREQHRLTNAELAVLRALVHGMRRSQIARDHCKSINTVKTQVRAILSKSGAGSVRELMHDFAHSVRLHAGHAVQ